VHEGQRHRGPTTFKAKTDALAFLASIETDIRRGGWINPELAETRFSVVADRLMQSSTAKRPSSIQRDRGILKLHVLPVLGEKVIGSIRPTAVQTLVDSWVGKYSNFTVHRHYATVRSVLSYAEASEMILRSPCRGIRLPKIRQVRRPNLDVDQLERLSDELGPVGGLFMWCGAILGMRWSEIAGLTVDRLDVENRTVTVDRQLTRLGGFAPPKSEAGSRVLGIPTWMAEDFSDLVRVFKRGSEGLVFQTDVDTPFNYENWRNRTWLKAYRQVGLEGLRFHDLRSMAATALVAS
jgi:integrase